jgi:hypothetical protein
MPVVVEGIRVTHVFRTGVEAIRIRIDAIREVESGQVIDETVAVVVDPVPIRGPCDSVAVEIFAFVDPDVSDDIGMKRIESCVDDGDNRALALGPRPDFGHVDAIRTPEVAKCLAPGSEGTKKGVVGNERLIEIHSVIQLRVRDMRVGIEVSDQIVRTNPNGHFDSIHVR